MENMDLVWVACLLETMLVDKVFIIVIMMPQELKAIYLVLEVE